MSMSKQLWVSLLSSISMIVFVSIITMKSRTTDEKTANISQDASLVMYMKHVNPMLPIELAELMASLIGDTAKACGVDTKILTAAIQAKSSFNPISKSAGAVGLMGITSEDPRSYDIGYNLSIGCADLVKQMTGADGDTLVVDPHDDSILINLGKLYLWDHRVTAPTLNK